MHRVVFCKSMTFRWFLDVEPEKDGVKITFADVAGLEEAKEEVM